MVRSLGFVLLFAILLLPARANLGDTVEQAVARYGKPTGVAPATAKRPFGDILFRAAGYELILFVMDNKEIGARVQKLDKSSFSDAEVKDVMSAETSSAPWVVMHSSDPAVLAWSRSDGATALYDTDKHILILTSAAMAKAVRASEGKTGP